MSNSIEARNQKFIERAMARPNKLTTLSLVNWSSHPTKSRRQVQGMQSWKGTTVRKTFESLNVPGSLELRVRSSDAGARLDAKFVPPTYTRSRDWLMTKVNKVLAADKAVNIQAVANGFTDNDVTRLERMKRELETFALEAGAPVAFKLYPGNTTLTLVGKPVR